MPSTLLPTPAPSTEIQGKRASFSQNQIDAGFALPPAAIAAAVANDLTSELSPSSSSTTSNGSDSSYRPPSPQRGNQPTGTKLTDPSTAAPTAARPLAGARRKSSGANTKHNMLVNPASQHALMEPGHMHSVGQSYTIPPPPTRSRKIIQMKPRAQESPSDPSLAGVAASALKAQSNNAQGVPPSPVHVSRKASLTQSVGAVPASSQTAASSSATGTKRKQQAGPTTAAGRKIARKTAHSLIERRRRSKMNEEFAVLKDMIPACEGQEMHKLQVLSASIEYMRYLEQCLADLKTAHARCPPYTSPMSSNTSHVLQYSNPSPQHIAPSTSANHFVHNHHSPTNNEDSDMSDATTAPSPPHSSLPPSIAPRPMQTPSYSSHAPSVSPAIMPSAHVSPALNATQQRGSYSQLYGLASSSSLTYPGSAYSSHYPSPAFMPQMAPISTSQPPGYGAFRLNSPAISDGSRAEHISISAIASPREEGKGRLETPDKEATAALMMLNTDRRSWNGATQEGEGAATAHSSARSGRGMSVRDLLSH